MVPKWTQGFNRAMTLVWPQLAPFQAAVDKACFDINLIEPTAGVARFVALKLIMQRLAEQDVPIPDMTAFNRAVDEVNRTGDKHAADTYRRLQKQFGYDELPVRWSDESDRLIEPAAKAARVFDNCQRVLEGINSRADLIVVSASKTAAVLADLRQHDMCYLFKALCAQDFLPKKGTLLGLANRYARVMFIGDTNQDAEAAKAAAVPFFLVKPGSEAECWKKAEPVLQRFVQ